MGWTSGIGIVLLGVGLLAAAIGAVVAVVGPGFVDDAAQSDPDGNGGGSGDASALLPLGADDPPSTPPEDRERDRRVAHARAEIRLAGTAVFGAGTLVALLGVLVFAIGRSLDARAPPG